ncbi:hypothetical protein GCM10010916_03030 [Paenibacillus abyssi]|uniref:Uncharacterized protein n=2 Tax=Paenibacillus abyssi TaxID=1340531 RepID=A0A917FJK9_9BACL|nr:hypothetical protein GCM10010916_03030 [Paenibacillus abyssi]
MYRNFAVQQPLEKFVAQLDGVQSAKPVIDGRTVRVELQLKQGADLRDIYEKIATEGTPMLGGRELQLELKKSSNEKLDQLWSSMLFKVAEAMETRQYSKIPAAMQQLEQANEGLTVHTEMDDTNVYITMSDGKASKYIVLPRIPGTLGVWPNA